IKNGEGVFGLRRAFQQAGAKTVIMSLWAVNDDATQKLMSSFYSNWVTGMTKRVAFSNAQQEVRKQFPEPYFWGAFVMVGE
ncbi:MAG: CHAT domain-containing protein, partial [bacterium]